MSLAYDARLRSARQAEQVQRRAAEDASDRETFLYFNRILLAEREWSSNNIGRVEELLDACPAHLRGWEWHYLSASATANSRPSAATPTRFGACPTAPMGPHCLFLLLPTG